MRLIAIAAAAAVLGLGPQGAQAQEFPARNITVVNPNAPGGMSDIISRGMTGALQRIFKQPVITTSHTGAGGAVGAAYVAKAEPDGYTVLLNTVTFATIPLVDQMLSRPNAYKLDEFKLVARITADPLVLVVNPEGGAKTLKDFIALSKSKPGELVFSSTGIYSGPHLAMEMFNRAAGLKMRHVPANGAGPALTAVLGQHAAATMAPAGVASQHIQSGRVLLLAQTGDKRVPGFDAPTLKEAGYNAQFVLWAGIFAPAKTPDAVIKKWQAALKEASTDAEFKDAMAKLNVTIDYQDGPALDSWYKEELARLNDAIQAIGKIEGVK